MILPILLAASLGTASDPPPPPLFGADPAPTCAWPSAVSIGGCTATLIHPEVLVYAAHCGPEIPSAWFGETAFSGDGFSVPTDFCMVNELFDLGVGNDYAFCKLARPVTEVAFTPPLMGCETTLLTPGREVALVGFGAFDTEGGSGVKHELFTTLNFISDGEEAQTGDNSGFGLCFGDSGGPAYVRLDESVGGDGSWRAFGIASYINGGCGGLGHHTLIHNAIEFIESGSGIDVTPCHDREGGWNPSPACTAFETEPHIGEGKSWGMGCRGGPVTEDGGSCGPSFNHAEDLVAPDVAIKKPKWGKVYDSDPDSGVARFDVTAEASDAISGLLTVGLSVNGDMPDEAIDYSAPWEWNNVTLPPGVYTLRVLAVDHAGNERESDPVMIGVDQEPPEEPPPPPPDPGTSTGGDESSTGMPEPMTTSGTTAPMTSGTTDPPLPDESGQDVQLDDDGACACRGGGGARSAPALAGLLLLLIAFRRRSLRVV